jgi:hypothetical protein
MTRSALLAFMRRHRVAVQSSVSPSGVPQAALVGIAVGDDFELVFGTLQRTRKARNLRGNQRVAFVLGGWGLGEEQTVQYEGMADEPTGSDLDRVREIYFGAYPDGRDRLSGPGLVHVRVRPIWMRYSDFSRKPDAILEYSASDLAALE